jgi:Cu/Ag efflux protein CusF
MKTRYYAYGALMLGAALTVPLILQAAEEAKNTTKESASMTGSCCAAEPSADAAAESWALRGVVQSLLPEREALLVAHEEIPGFMRAMTMMFQVDPKLLPTLEAGDTITARMSRSESGAWLLDDVQIIEP